MFSDIFPDPTMLFRFKIDVQRLQNQVVDFADVDRWGLDSRHRMPPIERLGAEQTPIEAKLAWNEQGLFLQIEMTICDGYPVDLSERNHSVGLMVNTRYNRKIQKENAFCSTFNFFREPTFRRTWYADPKSNAERLIAGVLSPRQYREQTEDPNQAAIVGWARASTNTLTSWIRISPQVLHEYRPDEFPDIGLYFRCRVSLPYVAPGQLGLRHEASMVHRQKLSERESPSLYTHCRLI
ncbi:MAG: hypothetical protein NTV29_00610 [Planctomycetota bacterium]|jgi:hypothetical protein|nr:hypothetical protein [Planctomycetota bacterium]